MLSQILLYQLLSCYAREGNRVAVSYYYDDFIESPLDSSRPPESDVFHQDAKLFPELDYQSRYVCAACRTALGPENNKGTIYVADWESRALYATSFLNCPMHLIYIRPYNFSHSGSTGTDIRTQNNSNSDGDHNCDNVS